MEKIGTDYNVKTKKLPNSRLEISASVPNVRFDAYRDEAIRNIGKEIEVPGFRKGHVPEKILSSRIGEARILEEMVELAVSRAYAEIIISEKIDALGRPEVRITKIAQGNPFEFTIVTDIFPSIELPDYKKISRTIAKRKEKIEVSEEDVDRTIVEVRRMRARALPENEGKELDAKAPLPELDDAFVKTLGAYEGVADFKQKLKENIAREKERESRDKVRIAIMEELVKASRIELPEIIIEQELHRMQDEFSHEVERMGLTWEAYMKAAGKTEEEMHREWRDDAKKRAATQLIASKIAEVENLQPTDEEMEGEIKMLASRYPDADPSRIRGYVEMLLSNEKVFSFLESVE